MDVNLGTAFIWFVVFLFSTTVHEAMHAFVAWKGGDPTAYHGGQVSLSPIPHVRREPLGMLAVPLLTALTSGWPIGWASAPYDPVWAERHPARATVMAAAGPAGNFAIAALAFIALKAGLLVGWFAAPDRVTLGALVEAAGGGGLGFAGALLSASLMLNVLLGTFNLLPLPPLDGSAVFSFFLPEKARASMNALQSNGAFSFIGLMVAWQIAPVMTDPLFLLVLRLLHPDAAYE
jgi:Zn-dependent protease